MSTLQNKTIVVVGGSSGIGFGVALASLQYLAATVIIASSNKGRVEGAVSRLKAYNLPGEVRGEVLDAKDSSAVKAFAAALGLVDHVVWTGGEVPKGEEGGGLPYSNVQSAEEGQAIFTLGFWGPFILARNVKFNPGGSLILTGGVAGHRPFPGGYLASGAVSALEGLTRGLALEFSPIRVNLVCPGMILDKMFGEHKDSIVKAYNEKILLKRAGEPSEIAEAYIFLMKCGYITGQPIYVEGGFMLL
ncbi:Short-chain dehydrogenase/reductase ATR9 [Psilocybe cubensis]|uniref:Short-chain dehydrogenase/reductase ATR9 n=1 Tax=Psilocybe cubensis TaxID=181762 RepID=A0ACB8GJK4_PSICU|nr:Short-chain dehydrogenase/reductase ATR9 [Psilocybe cubensis]KAH9475711.1 Short-chain dehydrogenase/reductase ATR9 [Psilocybe cubensis]